jgi:hypothetical protein
VLLLTDGLANRGVTDPDALLEMAKSAGRNDGVGTSTIGIGEGFHQETPWAGPRRLRPGRRCNLLKAREAFPCCPPPFQYDGRNQSLEKHHSRNKRVEMEEGEP